MSDDGRASENQNVIPLRVDMWDGSPFEMTTERILRIKMRMGELGIDQAALSNRTGLSNSAISQLLTQKIKKTRYLPKIAKALDVNMAWLLAETDQRVDLTNWRGEPISEDRLPQLLADEEFAKTKIDNVKTEGVLAQQFERKWDAVTVAEIDLANAGTSTLKGIPVKPHGHVFSREVLRSCTSSDGSNLMMAQGIGDAMQPVLFNSDVVFFDTAQRVLDCLDAIWLMRYAGMLTVRRARKMPDGIRLMADNPLLPDIQAAEGDVEFLGKVAGVVRKL